jgi:Lon protease-like protein
MGSDMEFITQPAASLEEGRVYELLALVQSGIVTFPEHILPLVLYSPPLISALRSVFNDLKVIALIPAKPNSSTADPSLAQFGTTAEVYEYSGSEPGLRIKTRVKQRFKVIATWIDEYE